VLQVDLVDLLDLLDHWQLEDQETPPPDPAAERLVETTVQLD